MVDAWLLFPLVVLAVSFGCGLLVERAGGWRLAGVLVVSVGLAVVIVVATLITESASLARFGTWVIVALALIGYAVSWTRLRAMRVDPWALALGVLVFAVFAAPIVTSGQATFAGYGVDGDPAFHFALIRELLAHGHTSVYQLQFPGSGTATLTGSYLATDYPLGADLAVGVLRPLVGQDVAWIYAPFIAVFMAFGGLALDELLRDFVRSRPLRALCAFIAAQAGLAYSFFLISSIKELATTWIITVTVVLAMAILRRAPSVRALIPLLVAVVAALDVLAIPVVPWLGIPLAVFVLASLWRLRPALARRPSPTVLLALAGLIVVTLAAALPILSGAAQSVSATTNLLGQGTTLGDLIHPLSSWQIMGIWPSGDFRYRLASDVSLVHVLLWIAVVSAVLGAAWALRRRAWGPLLLMLGNGIAAWVLLGRSGAYAASKVEMILSVTAVMAAMLGAVALHDAVHRVLGWALAVVIAAAVLWTNGLNFEHARLAPRPRFAELAQIDSRFHGQGPTFYNLWDFEFPGYFLRDMGPALLHIFGEPLQRPGTAIRTVAQLQTPWDPNDLTQRYLQGFRILVLGRSPILSRPPADYRLVYQGRYYDVYRRQASPRVLQHVPVTGALHPVQPLSCRRIRRLGARAAREHARLAVAPRPTGPTLDPIHSLHPASWTAFSPGSGPVPNALGLSLSGGTLTGRIQVPSAGRYTVWMQGSLVQRLSIAIALRPVGSVSGQIGPAGLFTDVGTVRLPAGEQPVIMHRSGASRLAPVQEGDTLGELVLTHGDRPPAVRTVAPSRARSLCGTPLQWLEIVS